MGQSTHSVTLQTVQSWPEWWITPNGSAAIQRGPSQAGEVGQQEPQEVQQTEMLSPAPGEEQSHPPAQAAGQSGWKAPLQKRPWCFWLNMSQKGALMAKKSSSLLCCTLLTPYLSVVSSSGLLSTTDMGILEQGQQRATKMRKTLDHICDYKEKPRELFSLEKWSNTGTGCPDRLQSLSILGETQNLTGYGAKQHVLVDPSVSLFDFTVGHKNGRALLIWHQFQLRDEKHQRSDKKEKFFFTGGQTLELVAQTDCRVSILGDIQNLTGYGTEQPALVDSTGWRLNHFPGQPVPRLDNPFSELKFPNIQSKPSLAQLEAISSCPITCYLGEEADPHLSTTSFQVKLQRKLSGMVMKAWKAQPLAGFVKVFSPSSPSSAVAPHHPAEPGVWTMQPPSLPLGVWGNWEPENGFLPPPTQPLSARTGPREALGAMPEGEPGPTHPEAGWRLNHFPGQPVPMLDNTFSEVKFPNIQSKPPLAQLEAISSCPITCYLGEEADPHLSTTSFQVVVESNKVSPQPPFLQAKQPQFPQPLLTGLLLQTLHQLRCPSLDTLQHLNVSLVVGGPKLNTVFQVRPHQCRVQGRDHFPSPAGHAIFDTSQDAIGFLGHLGTLLAHIQPAISQHPPVLLCQAAFQPLFPKPVVLHGVAVTQGQDLALGLVEPHTIGLGPSIQPVQSLPTLKQINTPAQLGVIRKLTDPLVQIIDKDIRTGPNTEPWGTPPVTSRQLDLTPFTTTLYAWPSNQFFT
ncbi:LOW QUALITY PROTEIN: hypothetical protein QYF61_014047 [Mycteria americana]|uniref:Uncharacterized protein n=1 Tax=Mycteria americana TaxID=33587 RepID=A0AAN7S0Y7_MYCAM|nr:LOW QUALITY PROTEIN: hypothetical protein QYF61_014047 [Mycteria americana]